MIEQINDLNKEIEVLKKARENIIQYSDSNLKSEALLVVDSKIERVVLNIEYIIVKHHELEDFFNKKIHITEGKWIDPFEEFKDKE